MAKDDNKLIWRALVEEANPDAKTYAGGMKPGPIEELNPAYGEEESSGGCPNLDKLIASDEEEHDEYHPGYGKVEGDFGNRNFKYLLRDVSELSSDPGMEDAPSDDWRQRLDDIVRDYSEWRTVGEDESDEEEDDDTVVARQGRGETAAQFKAADDTEFG